MSTDATISTETRPTPTTPSLESERGMLVLLAVITVSSMIAMFLAS